MLLQQNSTYFAPQRTSFETLAWLQTVDSTDWSVFDDETCSSSSSSNRVRMCSDPLYWSPDDILTWVYDVASEFVSAEISHIRGENFQGLTGQQLCCMSRTEFTSRDPRIGHILFECLQEQLRLSTNTCRTGHSTNNNNNNNENSSSSRMCIDNSQLEQLIEDSLLYDDTFWDKLFDAPVSNNSNNNNNNNNNSPDSMTSHLDDNVFLQSLPSTPETVSCGLQWNVAYAQSAPETEMKAAVRSAATPRGRQTKKTTNRRASTSSTTSSTSSTSSDVTVHKTRRISRTKSRVTHLWEFMRALLDSDDYNPTYVKWENKAEGVFRIVPGQSSHVAELWGAKKKNPSMTFEKMSRSLRWCREHGFFSDVPKTGQYPKKLCFRFGELAEDWRRINYSIH